MTDEKTTVTIDEYKTALAKIQSQTTEIKQLKDQLQESTDAMMIIKTKFDAAEAEEKDVVTDELVRNSQGKLTKESLKDATLKELYFLKDNLDKAEPKSFVSVMRQHEVDSHKPKVIGTVGSFNQETKKFEGGLE